MKRLFRSPAALLAAIAALRSAGFAFGILNIDESDYVVYGAGILRGVLPYRDVVEIKPPLGYLTYVPAGLFGGLHIWPMRIIGVFWVFAIAMLLRAAVREWMSARNPELTGFPDDAAKDAGWCAAWLLPLATLCEVPSMGGELMLDLPAAAALYFLARAFRSPHSRARYMALAGTFASLASLYKHQGAIVLVAFGLERIIALVSPRAKPRLQPLSDGIFLAIGFAIPWAVTFALYASLHQLPAFLEWCFARNFQYAGKGIGAGSPFIRFAQSTLLCCGATIVPWVLASKQSWNSLRQWWASLRGADQESARDEMGLAGTLTLWLTWLAVATGGRFYEHYYLQFATPLAFLAAPEAARLLRSFATLSPRRRTAWILGCALPLLGLVGYSWGRGIAGGYPAQEPRARAVGAFVQEHSAPDETMFVWGHYSPLYLLAQRMPGTRYVNTERHMGGFDPNHLPEDFDAAQFRSQQDIDATIEDLRRRRPAIVIDTAPADIHQWHKVPLGKFPDLKEFIEGNYRVIGNPAGAVVYRRRDL